MAVPISNVTRRQVYAPSGAGGAGPYAFTFEILANTDIAVYKDDTLLTLTTHYTVTINANGTGSVTITATGLALPPASPTQYAIVGNRTISRTTDFTTGGDFFANVLNDELDQQTIFAQQNAEGLQRALAAPQTDPTSINMTLPRASLRANKALGFDANGNPVISDTLGTNRGNWAAGTLYYVRDIVKDTTNNNIWQVITQHTSSGSQPINTNADSAKWTLLVDAATATTSATNAAASASAASTSASNASTSASSAATSASSAATSASNAATSATNAATSETNAFIYANNSATYANGAATSAAAAATTYDAFDDRYLGSKASDPSVDNDGAALLDGALYWDTTNNILKVYDQGATTWRRTTPTTSDQANINTVSGIAANVTTVATNSANVTTVASNLTGTNSIGTVAANIANVNAVGSNIFSVIIVESNATNINTVSGSIASVNTNATNIANINQNAANITAIQNASANATAAAASATTATTQANNAAASAAAASAVVLGNEPVRASVRPSLLLDFANTKQLDPRITFTRASTGTFYDGVTVAKAEENLLLRSQEFDNAAWAKSSATVSPNDAVAPDGTSTADTITIQNTGAVSQEVISPSSLPYTMSIWLRAAAPLTVNIGHFSPADVTACSVTTTWQRFTHTSSRSGAFYPQIFNNSGSAVTVEVWGAQVEQRSTVTAYTATTTQRITNYIPALLTAAAGVPRFEHNPTTGESLGLEIEEQRTNLVLQSQFASGWSVTRATLSANQIVAPDGTLTGAKLIEDTSASSHFTNQTVTIANSTAHTFTFYAKAGGRNWATLWVTNLGTSGNTYFDLQNGVLGTVGTGVTATITSVGNGWYRCSVTGTSVSTSTIAYIGTATANNTNTAAGNNFDGIYIWGAQLEAGAFATSYIQTVASQVTRSADAASMTGANFSSWYRADEGTLYGEGIGASSSCALATINTGTSFNNMIVLGSFNSTNEAIRVWANGSSQAGLGILALNTNAKVSLAYATNNIAASINGTTALTDTSAIIPSVGVDTLQIGRQWSATQQLAGTIKKIAYYPKRLTNAELQGITTV